MHVLTVVTKYLKQEIYSARSCDGWSLQGFTVLTHPEDILVNNLPIDEGNVALCAGNAAWLTAARQETGGDAVCVCCRMGRWWLFAVGQGSKSSGGVFLVVDDSVQNRAFPGRQGKSCSKPCAEAILTVVALVFLHMYE